MSTSTLIEIFRNLMFSFTRGVTENHNLEEPEFTAESFGYNPLESTGREWYYHPVDEFIYQEYSDREAMSLDYLASSRLDVRVTNACSPEDNSKAQGDQQDEDRTMAWKRLRPSTLRTVCKSMYTGALISLLSAIFVGTIYVLVSYVSYKTKNYCEYHPIYLIPIQVQWFRTISGAILYGFVYFWYFSIMLFLFRPFQLSGAKKYCSCVVSFFIVWMHYIVLLSKLLGYLTLNLLLYNGFRVTFCFSSVHVYSYML